MYVYDVEGGVPLNGEVWVSGAKNSALPILAATILTDEKVVVHNVPVLRDINTMIEVLKVLGKKVDFYDHTVVVEGGNDSLFTAPYDLVRKMRASIAVLGPLLAKRKKASVSFPGGCAIGPRPVDIHLRGMEALGAEIKVEHGYINADAGSGLKGSVVDLLGRHGPSVLATENVMMASVLAEGETIIENAAMEPEVVDLAGFLKSMGAEIEGEGSSTIKIRGVKELKGTEYTIIPDRIEAGTFIAVAMATGGNITIKGVKPEHLESPIDVFKSAGGIIEVNSNEIKVQSNGLKPVDVETRPYPGFPTDLQAQLMAVVSTAPGISVITENIFPTRFLHVPEMNRMGANIVLEDSSAIIHGVEKLSGASVMVSDLRAGAGLVIAALSAEGKSRVNRIYHIERGYENLEEKLQSLGARIKKVYVEGV